MDGTITPTNLFRSGTVKLKIGKYFIFGVLCLGSLTVASCALAHSSDWMIQPQETADLMAAAPLSIGVPADFSTDEIARIGVEVDNIDVTALITIQDGKLVYRPAQAFEPGRHELRVIEYETDGQLLPRGSWTFTIKSPSRAISKPSVEGSVTATVSDRLADSNLTPPVPKPLAVSGTFNFKAVKTVAEWTTEGNMTGLYGSNDGTAITGQGVQPAQMSLNLKRGKYNLVLGDQTLPYNNLLISGLSRRGISANAGDMPLGVDAEAFSMRASSVAGFYGGLGVTDGGDNVSGMIVQSHPLNSPQALALTAAYVTGTVPSGLSIVTPYPGGNSTFPPSTPLGTVVPVQSGSGSGWVVSADSQIPNSALHLNGQYSSSVFDFSGIPGQPSTNESDSASSLGMNYSHLLPRQWMLGATVNYQNVGTFFRSLANQSLPPDQRMTTASGTLSGHGLQLAASAGSNEDNTADNPVIATVRTLPRSLTASYGPILPASITSWLGTPSLNLGWQTARTNTVSQPAGTQPTDSKIVNYTMNLNFAYPIWSWQLGLMEGSFRDNTGQQDNTDTFAPTLGWNLSTESAGSYGLNVQFVNTHDLQQDTNSLDRNYTLSAADRFLAGKLTGQLTLSINHNTQQIIPGMIPPQLIGSEVVLKTATAQIIWHAIPAAPNRSGLDVGLSSSWNNSTGLNAAVLTSQGFSSLATRGFQTFLTLSSTWPIGGGDK